MSRIRASGVECVTADLRSSDELRDCASYVMSEQSLLLLLLRANVSDIDRSQSPSVCDGPQ